MKVLDLFSGCGGLSYGFMQAGFEVKWFVEQWSPAITTFLHNHPEAQLLGTDIREISDELILPLRGEVYIIVGGPPCQGFSLCGKRDPKDERNQLYKEYLRFVRCIKPKFFVMENVTGLLNMPARNKRMVIDNILHDLISLGYTVSYKILSSEKYGVAQKRQRLFIIGKRESFFPYQTHWKPKTVMQAITKPEILEGLNADEDFDTQQETLEKIKQLKQGERISPKFNFSRQRLCADKPSKTVTTKPIFIHPYEHRFLTPRELARLQSFPDEFFFCGSKTSMVKQIGNAVPPLLAQLIAEKLKEVMANE